MARKSFASKGVGKAPPIDGHLAAAPPEATHVDWEKVAPDFTFQIISPPPNPNPKKRKRNVTDGQHQSSPFSETLSTDWAVEPADHWEQTQRYRKFTISKETFEVGNVLLIKNDEGTITSDPDSGLSPLANVLKNQWVAHVLEVRAGDEHHVYLRVYYLYRPEDLPMGRQPYHGTNELLASNEMCVIDAMTVNQRISTTHWDENDDSQDIPADLFWRQEYNFDTKKISKLRTHCICDQPYNPDPGRILLNCANNDCKKWLHGECIEKDAIKRAYKANDLKYPIQDSDDGSVTGTSVNGTPKSKTKNKWKKMKVADAPPKPPKPPVKLDFSAMLKSEASDTDDETINTLFVTDLRKGKRETKVMPVECLFCRHVID
ncbi:hypothetical protein K402DRAFT_258286 [Aulographum hederae CBS 113979]|uniref:BAH domain-containing protein n=1 Tax=Aulographum hederae CBS 113979 TaxID=1176131 RepID=A0A6G1H8Q7_9PEZI|nr:hypothetical protein K402DRAFT_258286 [Aulographum hederae CBS 113979]